VIMQQRLRDMGDWLTVNGEAIYETQAWKKAPATAPAIRFTRKGRDIYILCTSWQNEITLPLAARPSAVQMLGVAEKPKTSYKGGKLTIKAPQVNPGNMPCQHAWVYKLSNVLAADEQ